MGQNHGMDSIPARVTVRSKLAVSPEELWQSVASAEGVNHEMGPWLRFVPPAGENLLEAAGRGEVLKLKIRGPLGIPLGNYPLRLVRLEEGRGFLEQTQMLPCLLWQHERTIEAEGDGTVITDRLGWRWKLRLLDPLLSPGVGVFFRHRHRKLRSRFGIRS